MPNKTAFLNPSHVVAPLPMKSRTSNTNSTTGLQSWFADSPENAIGSASEFYTSYVSAIRDQRRALRAEIEVKAAGMRRVRAIRDRLQEGLNLNISC